MRCFQLCPDGIVVNLVYSKNLNCIGSNIFGDHMFNSFLKNIPQLTVEL